MSQKNSRFGINYSIQSEKAPLFKMSNFTPMEYSMGIGNEEKKLHPSTKPCRFLKERVADSEVSGIPCKIEHVCVHPVFNGVLDRLQEYHERARFDLSEANRLMTTSQHSPIIMSSEVLANNISAKLQDAYEQMNHATALLREARERYPQTDIKADRYFTLSDGVDKTERKVTCSICGGKKCDHLQTMVDALGQSMLGELYDED